MNIINANLLFTGKLTKRKKTTMLIIHHAAAPSASVETIHKWHLGRGWLGIGYNFYVRRDGTVYQGRGWEYVGAHCAGYNSASVGICLEGNYETDQDMPAAQYEAAVQLIRQALDKYPTITEICGHKAHGATACPGRYFPLADMIADAKGTETVDPATSTNTATSTITYNANVESLQEALNADGITDAAGRSLVVDGLKGANTSVAIKKTLLKAGTLSEGRYRVGSTGEVVRWVQARLNVLLSVNLAEDGKYGNDTRAAVLQWQEINNLSMDGVAGVDTITSLLCLDQ
ncbi:MAG: N-acetylmuramoyl-L-alanine amidase [Lachnospiraceae bacterium]|nr:N-acetylmuramoyl-L-alanine amidase [Lachnospiraceae bacterium]